MPAADLPASGNAALFTPSQRALSVLDGMAVCEVAWHEGGSLPETLYACLYLHPAVFSAMLGGLGWAPPPAKLAAAPRLDLRIKQGGDAGFDRGRGRQVSTHVSTMPVVRCRLSLSFDQCGGRKCRGPGACVLSPLNL